MTFSGIILGVLLFSVLVQLIYVTILYCYIPIQTIGFNNKNKSKVSVIIAAKNESKNLPTTINSILRQTYPNFELIVADDFSSDDTEKIVSTLAKKHKNLIYQKVKTDKPGKRQAISEAIALCTGDSILLTDADCIPCSRDWITSMQGNMPKQNGLVLGIAPFTKKNNLVNRFARFEGLLTAFQYVGASFLGVPYMGVGRNLMYSKSIFNKVNGYQGQEHLSAGDDDLLVQKMTKEAVTTVNMNTDSFVYSDTESSLSSYIAQKKRHLGVSNEYRWQSKLLLSIFSSTQIIIFTLAIGFIWLEPRSILGILIFRWIIYFGLTYRFFDIMKYKDLKKWFPLLDILYFVYLVYFLPNVFTNKSSDWNDIPRANR